MNETSELASYRSNVERLANLDSREMFSNGQIEHAVIILETFFKFATKKVEIFCNKLSNNVYGGDLLIDRVEHALRNNVQVTILTKETPESESFLSAAQCWAKGNLPISISIAPETSVTANFAVMDGKGYRFEANYKPSSPEAIACMNDPENADLLSQRFFQFRQGARSFLKPATSMMTQAHAAGAATGELIAV